MKNLLKTISITVLVAIMTVSLFACDVGVKNKQPTNADYVFTLIGGGNAYAIGLSEEGKNKEFTLISLPTEYNGKPVTQISPEGFYGVSVKSVYIPEGYQIIGRDAFGHCENLTEIEISKTVESIGDRAFAFCSKLKNIDFKTGLKSIGSLAFLSCDAFSDILLPSSLEEISENAFADCERLNLHIDGDNPNFTVEDNKIIKK